MRLVKTTLSNETIKGNAVHGFHLKVKFKFRGVYIKLIKFPFDESKKTLQC